jgi:ribonuclease PH
VLQADGGTRTAAITGACVALVDALRGLRKRRQAHPGPDRERGRRRVGGHLSRAVPVLDLDYAEDSDCDTDMNVVMTDGGGFIEVQGTAEGHAFRRAELDGLLGLAETGIAQLLRHQQAALAKD